MPDEWFVRVQEKEYGPVDLETLLEWKADERLIPQNEVRHGEEAGWLPAAQFPELFASEPIGSAQPERLFRRRGFGQIIAESLRIYGRGFPQFFALALLVAIPSLALNLGWAFVDFREGEPMNAATRAASIVIAISLTALLLTWPIFVGGLQFATVELAAGRKVRLKEILRRAFSDWSRLARLSLFVYGSYVFWTVLPLMAILALASAPSLISIFIALVVLAFQVYMASRLFVNFMFWQQSCVIAGLEGIEALRESKELAHSRSQEPRLQRPLYRGAIFASIWLVLLLILSVAIEMPFTLVRLQGITSLEEGMTLMQQLMHAPVPDTLTIASYVASSLAHAALRPLLGILFVVLYFDSKATR
ncbi:MAG: DUF4339 domain-containing protein [Verrucomicrobiota bacterium]|nr:DUF4339 domain-containing protein [Verrucomicrobiota bacterium]